MSKSYSSVEPSQCYIAFLKNKYLIEIALLNWPTHPHVAQTNHFMFTVLFKPHLHTVKNLNFRSNSWDFDVMHAALCAVILVAVETAGGLHDFDLSGHFAGSGLCDICM